jgi:hypothetical protein
MATLATADDVLRAVKVFAEANVTTLPGGWHHESPPANVDMPYAVVKCEESEWEEHSLGSVATYRVTVEVRTREGQHDQRAIDREVGKLHRYPTLALPNTNARVIHCLAMPGKLTEEPQQHQARDVELTVRIFDVVVGQPKGN